MIEIFNKPKVLRAQPDAAVVLVSLEETFVAAHTIIMACEELFRSWYVKKDIYVEFDYRIMIKDEYHRDYLDKMRQKYNYFKHADRDTDETLDVDHQQIHRLNETLLALLVHGYRKVFGELTAPMDIYSRWLVIAYPHLIKWDNVAGGSELRSNIEKVKNNDADKRQMLRVMLDDASVLPKEDFQFLRLWKQTLRQSR